MYTIVKLKQTCTACPSQWEGVLDDGREIYIRYRFGYLEARVGDEEVFDKCIGDGMAGFLSTFEMQEQLSDIFDFP